MQTAKSSSKSPSTGPSVSTAVTDRLLASEQEYLGYFRRRLNPVEDAEDAFQDFCLKVVRHAGTLEDETKIDAWLRRIRNTTLIDFYRRRASKQRAESAYEREPQWLEAEPIAAEDVCGCVRGTLPTLRHDYVDILQRVELEQQTRDQIATELDLSKNNVGVRLHRARRALKVKIQEECPTCGDGHYRECDCEAGQLEAA